MVNWTPSQNEKRLIERAFQGITAVFQMALSTLTLIQASDQPQDRGHLRLSIKYCFAPANIDNITIRSARSQWYDSLTVEEKRGADSIRIMAPPTISTKGDMAEFDLRSWNETPALDGISLGVSDGPVIIRFEVLSIATVATSIMKTFLYENDSTTPLLQACLTRAQNFILDTVKTGVDLGNLNAGDFQQVCLAAAAGFSRVRAVEVLQFSADSTLRLIAVQPQPTVLRNRAVRNQVCVIHVLLKVTLQGEGEEGHFIGFESPIEIGDDRSLIISSAPREPYFLVPKARRWQDSYTFQQVSEGGKTTYKADINPFWQGGPSPALPRANHRNFEDLVNRLDISLRPLEIYAGLTPIDICLLLFKCKVGKELSACNHLQKLGWELLSYALPDKNTLKIYTVSRWMLDHSRRYSFTDQQLQERKDQVGELETRDQEWVNEVDGPALRRARDVMAHILGVTSQEVSALGRKGVEGLFPEHLSHPHHGDLRLWKNSEPKFSALRILFAFYSGRANPWTVFQGPTMGSRINTWKGMIVTHIGDEDEAPKTSVTWMSDSDRAIGRQVLNAAAASGEPPFQARNIAEDDWEAWYDFLSPGRGRSAERSAAIRYIGQKISEAFPQSNLSYGQKRELTVNLPDQLWTHAARKEQGKYTINDSYWTTREFFLAAIVLYLCAEVPVNPHEAGAGLKAGTLYCLKKYIPTRTVAAIQAALDGQYDKFQYAYQRVSEEVQEYGLRIFGEDMSDEEIQQMRSFGIGDGDVVDIEASQD